jgi:hypothetical protein
MLLASAWIPTSLWGATREIGLYSATASAPLVLKRADRPWAHTVIEKPMSAVVFRAPVSFGPEELAQHWRKRVSAPTVGTSYESPDYGSIRDRHP